MATTPAFPVTPPYTPELLKSVQEEVVAFLAWRRQQATRPPRVLEVGAGYSTVWFAGLDVDLVSLEHDFGWWTETWKALDAAGLKTDLRIIKSEPLHKAVRAMPDRWFDLILIDCLDEERVPCFAEAVPKLKADGWLILDDTHWDILEPACVVARDWDRKVLHGQHRRHDGSEHLHHTTFFFPGHRKPVQTSIGKFMKEDK